MPSRSHYAIAVTPAELDRLAITPSPDDEDEFDDPIDALDWHTEVAPYLDLIPAVEADLIELRRIGCREADLALVLGLGTQAAVSYRLGRAIQRLRFERLMATYPSIADIRNDLSGIVTVEQLGSIIRFVATTNHSHGLPDKVSGTRSRHLYHAGLKRLRKGLASGWVLARHTSPMATSRSCTPGPAASCAGTLEGVGIFSCYTIWHRFSRCRGRFLPPGQPPPRKPWPLTVYVDMLTWLVTDPAARHMRYVAPPPPHARRRVMEGELVSWVAGQSRIPKEPSS